MILSKNNITVENREKLQIGNHIKLANGSIGYINEIKVVRINEIAITLTEKPNICMGHDNLLTDYTRWHEIHNDCEVINPV